MIRSVATALSFFAFAVSTSAQDAPQPSVEQRLDELERENRALHLRLDALDADVERSSLRELFPRITESRYGLGPAASKVYGVEQGLSIGGYGEAIFVERQGSGSDTADFQRAITYFGYKF